MKVKMVGLHNTRISERLSGNEIEAKIRSLLKDDATLEFLVMIAFEFNHFYMIIVDLHSKTIQVYDPDPELPKIYTILSEERPNLKTVGSIATVRFIKQYNFLTQ